MSPPAITPPAVFYHVAAMNTWRSVAGEQLRLLAHVGLTAVTVGLLGDREDAATVTALADRFGVTATVGFQQPDLSLAELPTLSLLHTWARDHPGGDATVLYLHTKGVSRPADRGRAAWRRLMQRHVVADWPANAARLAGTFPGAGRADLVGVNWIDSPALPYFAGNVWMARADWVAALDPPHVYRLTRPADFVWGDEPWRVRMFAETWVASRPGPRVASLACRNERFRDGPAVYGFDPAVPGFRYDEDDDAIR